MKHITFAQKSLLAGDEVCDLLTAYAARLTAGGASEDVTIRALGVDGEEVDATFVLGPGSDLLVESTTSQLPEPDNQPAIERLRERLGGARPPFDPDLDL
jgi:hypothetical protein